MIHHFRWELFVIVLFRDFLHALFSFGVDNLNLGLNPDMTSYNVLLKACCVAGRVDLAQDIYKELKHLESVGRLKLDVFTYSTIIKVFADAKMWQMALKIKQDMLSAGVSLNTVAWSSLINACAHAGLVEQAIQLFEEMLLAGCEPNTQCFNIILHACVEAFQYDRAFRFFHSWKGNKMLGSFGEGHNSNLEQGDMHTATTVPNGISNSHILSFAKRFPFTPTTATYNILLKACGTDYYHAKALINEMKKILKTMSYDGIRPDVIMYTTAIKGNVQNVSISSDAKALVTSDFESKNLKVWRCDLNSGTVISGPTLPMRHSPLVFECHHGCNEEDDLAVVAVSGSGAAYIWNLSLSSEDEIRPTKITVKINKQNNESSKKKHSSIIASRLQPFGEDKQMKALVAYGSVDHPQFTILNISNSGENIVLNAGDEIDSVQQHDSPEKVPVESKKTKKRQATSDPDLPTTTDKVDLDQSEAADGVLLDDDPSEPTMGEKLASLSLLDENISKSDKEQESSVLAKPPSADSVHVLLNQALNADDRALLLDCLYTQDEKVIKKSVAELSPSNVLKLLRSLISIIESRGAILACALPWLKCLLLHHASGIMSQESSLKALNSLYQLIESRVSTFKSAIQLSSCLDILYTGVIEEEVDEGETIPVIYEDKDSDEESEDAMETDQDSEDEQQSEEAFDDVSDIEGSDDMMGE